MRKKVAVHILRAVERNRAVAPVTPEVHVAYVLSRTAPPLSRQTSAKLAGVAKQTRVKIGLRPSPAGRARLGGDGWGLWGVRSNA